MARIGLKRIEKLLGEEGRITLNGAPLTCVHKDHSSVFTYKGKKVEIDTTDIDWEGPHPLQEVCDILNAKFRL